MFATKKTPVVKSFTHNPRLKTINPGWPGTPLDQDGLFINHEYPWLPDYREIAKYMLERNPQRQTKGRDTWKIAVIKGEGWLNDARDKIVWLGHASFFIQLSGKRLLIDPVFGELPVGKRFSELPIDPKELFDIDYILVSHAHYDHCDQAALKLLAKYNPNVQIIAGLKLDKLIREWTDKPIHTAGWFQEYDLQDDLRITFLPSRHWANRGLFDVNTSLWGGFMIQGGDKSIYYGGDSGYGSHFKEIGNLFPSIDVALIGAGAYAPTWFMAPNHQNPFDALKAFHDTRAKTFVPFHYGTFDSADEPLGEPEQILRTLEAGGKIQNKLSILKLGESLPI
ncbi:MAG TPA: MBL fold metallo-hydrolase [Ohtaekwangia sp.]|uniref:MBL fold metallo-hydrolase n=1 Tax=Ohtaekwangia sp. TaxID=2066019 RepID=UPI002F955AD0